MRGRHVEGRRAAAIDGRRAVPARKDLGLRPDQRLGVGRLQRRVRHRPGRGTGDDEAQAALAHSERRLPAVRRREGPDLFPAVQLRAVSEPAEPGRVLRRRLRQHEDRQRRQDVQLQKFFAPFSGWFLTPKMRYYLYVWSSNASQGDPAQVVGAGNLTWTFNRLVERRCRHHVAALRAKHRGSVPVLARRGRPPDRRRVLPRARTPPASGSKASSTPRSSTRRCSPTT